MPTPPGLSIRPYQAGDHDAVYEVCVRTGDGGGDARGLYPNDDLLPDIYAGPYLYLEPGLAFVLDDGGRAVGYVIGTADTARFVARYRHEWIPLVAHRYQEPAGGQATGFEAQVAWLFHPERMLVDGLGLSRPPAYRPAARIPAGRLWPSPYNHFRGRSGTSGSASGLPGGGQG